MVDELPASHTSTIDFVELMISFDLLETSFKGMLIEAVIWPELKASELLRSTINAASWFERLINDWQDIFVPPFLEFDTKNNIRTITRGTENKSALLKN